MLVRDVIALIVARHEVASIDGLKLFLGEDTSDAETALKQEEYSMPLAKLKQAAPALAGGAMNDHVLQVITYVYAPYNSILHVPRATGEPPARIRTAY